MRFLKWTLPIGILFAIAGVMIGFEAYQPRGDAPPMTSSSAVRHVVNEKMEGIAGSWSRRQAPAIASNGAGKSIEWPGLLEKGPVFIYFIKDGCPCSVDAQPLFNRLRDKFKGKAAFIGVIDVDAQPAGQWAKRNAMTDILVADPHRNTIHAYRATNSAFSALVLPDGTIDKMWPGYSREYLLDMNRHISQALGENETKLDTAYAPAARTAGCYFE